MRREYCNICSTAGSLNFQSTALKKKKKNILKRGNINGRHYDHSKPCTFCSVELMCCEGVCDGLVKCFGLKARGSTGSQHTSTGISGEGQINGLS